MSRRLLSLAAAAVLGLAAACGPDVNLTKSLELKVTESGYFDAGIQDGQTRFLPSLTFELHNVGDVPLSGVELLFGYYQNGADGEYDSAMATGIGRDAVAPAGSTAPIQVRAQHGYAFPGARADFFSNSLFRDVLVKVFAKKRVNYMPIGEFKIDRRILEPAGRTPGAQ